jgi:stage III sporulation protein AF
VIRLEFIYNWIKNILIYLILVTIIQNLLPQGQYTKYIKVFTGLVLMLIVILPLATFSGIDKQLSFHLLDQKFQMDQKGIMKQYDAITEQQGVLILEAYKKELENQIKLLLESENIYVDSVRVEVNEDRNSEAYGAIKTIYITAKPEEVKESNTIEIDKIIISKKNATSIKTSEEIIFEKNIKNILINFYNLGLDNIHITIN